MSFMQKPKFRRTGNSWGNIVDFFSGRKRKQPAGARKRRLTFDPLEERRLLSVTVNAATDQLGSSTTNTQTTGTNGGTTTQAVASDDAGDFVVVWTRYDSVYDSDLGGTVTDANIYARYFTNEVRRIRSCPREQPNFP